MKGAKMTQRKLLIDYASDIHIGFWVGESGNLDKWKSKTEAFIRQLILSNPQKGDILILAGDFGESNLQTKWILEECGRHYKTVLATFGNHDYYLLSNRQRQKYKSSINRVNELIDYFADHETVKLVRNKTIEVESFTFGITPLWYTLNTEVARHCFSQQSNDYKNILTGNRDNWEPLHNEDITYYNGLSSVDCLITHMPPIDASDSNYPKDFYVTTVDKFKAPHWVCGHQHVEREFIQGGTSFHFNPIGYMGELYDLKNRPKLKQFELTK